VLHRPTSGSFVSYAREFLGEKASYVAGWMYFLNWAMTGIVDITAVALYMHYWGTFSDVPQWLFALGALSIVATMNMIGVKWFAEMEFWFALIKVVAIVLFLVVGVVFLGTGQSVAEHSSGLHLITDNGGFFPHGLLPALVLVQGVIFAFAGIELIGTAAGECKNPEKTLPKAINSVIWRIGLFYVGSVVLLVCLLPWNAYQAGQSPFVTFFSSLGVPYIGTIMNIVVLTAALSSLNSGLYSTGRILRSLSMGGSAPKFMSKMSPQSVPYAGILVTVGIYVLGVVLNYLVPSQVFEIVLNIASLGIISSWAFIIICQMKLRQAIKQGTAKPVSFKMPGAPVTSWLTLFFLVGVLVMMAFDYPNGTFTIATVPVVAILLIVGWFSLRKRASEVAAAPQQPMPKQSVREDVAVKEMKPAELYK
jgi:L-asparagine permease